MPTRRRSTLFPYTTLSDLAGLIRGRRVGVRHDPVANRSGETDRGRARMLATARARVVRLGIGQVRLGHHQDRKSTRLNSSHSSISYAVFCLKKKTQTELT